MVFEGKELSELKIEDIQFLKDNQIVEDISIEYKSRMWEQNDAGIREMLRDISSIANARGGHIILGIAEDEENDGLPKEIIGIAGADKAMERIMNVCLSCIDEKIRGLDTLSIPFKKGRAIVIIRIPRSTRIPHMITKNLYQCWRRHGRQKNLMSIDEVREACIKVESLRKDLEEFIEERKNKIIRNAQGKPALLISATQIIVKDDIVDIFDARLKKLLENITKVSPVMQIDLDCRNSPGRGWRPTLYGIKAEIQDWKSLEVLRNGHIECIATDLLKGAYKARDGKEYNVFNDWEIIEYIVSFIFFLKKFLAYISIFEPVIISVALINSENMGMFEHGTPIVPGRYPMIWKEEKHLILPSMQVSSIDNPQKIAKVFADRIWNAFGFNQAPFLDDDGNYTPPR